ncbi:MAG TPA: LPXTG cell wall anchor domain-containing protein [Myxococcota bacterium]|nr:LPXTG cell wall anchor domain-containing protein [Myxococcota bacterium]
MDAVALYKLGRLAVLALALVGIAFYVFSRKRRNQLELPARRMLEEDDA